MRLDRACALASGEYYYSCDLAVQTTVILGFGTVVRPGQGAGLFLYPPRTLAGGAPCSCKKYWLLRQRQLEFTFLKREG